MTRTNGRRSRAAPNASVERDLVADTLVIIGCALSLGLVGVSAFLNFRMGFRSADTEVDGWAYGLAAGMGDGLKALAPFVMYWGWKKRDALAVIAAAAVFVIMTAYSLTAALGFAELHRGAKQGERRTAVERHDDARKDIARTEARLEQLGPQRSEGEVDKAIAAQLAAASADRVRTVDQVSKGCTLNRFDSRGACAEVARLQEERERAREQARLEQVLGEARKALGAEQGSQAGTSDDPQIDVLQRAATLAGRDTDRKDVQFALSLLVALVVELGSGLGFYIATTPWRGGGAASKGGEAVDKARRRHGWSMWRRAPGEGKVDNEAARAGRGLETFAMERLEPREGGEVLMDELYDDYVVWCRWRGNEPEGRRLFAQGFGDLAEEVGIPTRGGADKLVCVGIGLVGR